MLQSMGLRRVGHDLTTEQQLPSLHNLTVHQLIGVNYSCQLGGSFPCRLAFWYKESEMSNWLMEPKV